MRVSCMRDMGTSDDRVQGDLERKVSFDLPPQHATAVVEPACSASAQFPALGTSRTWLSWSATDWYEYIVSEMSSTPSFSSLIDGCTCARSPGQPAQRTRPIHVHVEGGTEREAAEENGVVRTHTDHTEEPYTGGAKWVDVGEKPALADSHDTRMKPALQRLTMELTKERAEADSVRAEVTSLQEELARRSGTMQKELVSALSRVESAEAENAALRAQLNSLRG